jgi:ATP-dependent protease ClpP protease subunit
MRPFKLLCGAGFILLLWAIFKPSSSEDVAARQTLSISEEPDRIVLGWSGPVQEPMSERITAALDRYKADPRRLVLVLNSPGGSVEHGRKVVAMIRTHGRAIETFVDKAGVCASMCVPIFLTGARRIADQEAYFMFHQVSLTSARDNMKRPELNPSEKALLADTVKTIEAHVTDDFYRSDIGIRGVNAVWLARMREKIAGGDVWMSGQQLVDESSGIVDNLIRTAAR